jgi:hypothetical protein
MEQVLVENDNLFLLSMIHLKIDLSLKHYLVSLVAYAYLDNSI